MLAKKHNGKSQLVTLYWYNGVHCRQDRELCKSISIIVDFFTMLKIKCWWNKKGKDDQKKTAEKVAIRCSNGGK